MMKKKYTSLKSLKFILVLAFLVLGLGFQWPGGLPGNFSENNTNGAIISAFAQSPNGSSYTIYIPTVMGPPNLTGGFPIEEVPII